MGIDPNRKKIKGKWCRLVVFRVRSEFPDDGTPMECYRVREGFKARLHDDPEKNQFFTAWVPEVVLKKKK